MKNLRQRKTRTSRTSPRRVEHGYRLQTPIGVRILSLTLAIFSNKTLNQGSKERKERVSCMRNLPENRDPRKKPSTPLQSTPILQPRREKGEHAKRKEREKMIVGISYSSASVRLYRQVITHLSEVDPTET